MSKKERKTFLILLTVHLLLIIFSECLNSVSIDFYDVHFLERKKISKILAGYTIRKAPNNFYSALTQIFTIRYTVFYRIFFIFWIKKRKRKYKVWSSWITTIITTEISDEHVKIHLQVEIDERFCKKNYLLKDVFLLSVTVRHLKILRIKKVMDIILILFSLLWNPVIDNTDLWLFKTTLSANFSIRIFLSLLFLRFLLFS